MRPDRRALRLSKGIAVEPRGPRAPGLGPGPRGPGAPGPGLGPGAQARSAGHPWGGRSQAPSREVRRQVPLWD